MPKSVQDKDKSEDIKLLSFVVENFAAIQFAEVEITDNMVFVAGKNASGKTTLISAVPAALGDRRFMPAEPITKNHKYMKIFLDFNTFTVEKKLSDKGNMTLSIKDKYSGKTIKSPQTFLSKIMSPVVMNPVAFHEESTEENRTNVLYEITGLRDKITALDAKGSEIYTARTELNTKIRDIKGQISGKPKVPEKDLVEKSIPGLMTKLQEAQDYDSGIKDMQRKVDTFSVQMDENRQSINNYEAQINEFQEKIESAKAMIEKHKLTINQAVDSRRILKGEIEKAESSRVPEITEEINQAQEYNAGIQEAKKANQLHKESRDWQKSADALTRELEDISIEKLAILSHTDLPEGLTIEDGQIKINGLPWASQSSAQGVLMAMKIGHLQVPALRMMVLDWMHLDDKSKKVVMDFVDANDYLCLVEVVADKPQENMIFLEKGEIK